MTRALELMKPDPTRKVTVIFEWGDERETIVFDDATDFLYTQRGGGISVMARDNAPTITKEPRHD